MTYNFKPLLSQVVHPQHLTDLNLPEHTISTMERWVAERSLPNLLFYGKPGIGKTSAAEILMRELDADVYRGSCRDKALAKEIEVFARTASLFGRPKVCFIDEADGMSKDAQETLKYYVDKVSDETRFLLAMNDITKSPPALTSRFTQIDFDVPAKDVDAFIERMISRYQKKLMSAGYLVDEACIRETVCVYFPDLRKIANQLHPKL
jgi:replication factor C small subunit